MRLGWTEPCWLYGVLYNDDFAIDTYTISQLASLSIFNGGGGGAQYLHYMRDTEYLDLPVAVNVSSCTGLVTGSISSTR